MNKWQKEMVKFAKRKKIEYYWNKRVFNFCKMRNIAKHRAKFHTDIKDFKYFLENY